VRASYVVECFWPGVTPAQAEAAAERAEASAVRLRADAAEVRFSGSILVPDDETVFFLFDGASAAEVRRAAELAELPFERVLESLQLAGSHESSYDLQKERDA
jgi:hypothetical protein